MLLPIETPVQSEINGAVGKVIGHTVLTREAYLIVELDRGFWSEDHRTFVTVLVCHPDSVKEIPTKVSEG